MTDKEAQCKEMISEIFTQENEGNIYFISINLICNSKCNLQSSFTRLLGFSFE
jgi:hypothetical protein